MRVESGHFGSTKLDGLSFFLVVDFPGPLHEGNGTVQAIIDQQSTAEQRDALFQILSGKHAAEGTLFHIFSLIVSKMLTRSSPRSTSSLTWTAVRRGWRSRVSWRRKPSQSATQ